jgi:hypothetical protein
MRVLIHVVSSLGSTRCVVEPSSELNVVEIGMLPGPVFGNDP